MLNTVTIEPLLWLQLTGFITLALAGQVIVRKLHQPLLLGEILIGILVGTLGQLLQPTGVALFESRLIGTLGFLGAVFLLFTVGLESDLREIFTGRNLWVALGGVLLPWLGGFALAQWVFPGLFDPTPLVDSATGQAVCYYCTPAASFAAKIFVGSTMVATSVAVTASVLQEAGRLRGEVARTILGAAVVDDVLGMIVLAISVGISRGDLDLRSVLQPILMAAAFVALSVTLGVRYLGRVVALIRSRADRLGLPHTAFLAALVITFLMAFLSELVGLSPIIGAFMAGAILARSPAKDELKGRAEDLRGIFAPLFFVSIGLFANVLAFAEPTSALFLLGVTVVAFASKFVGCALPARLLGIRGRRAVAVGIGMIPRGEVALIIALFAFGGGIIGPRIYTSLVVMAVVTSLVPPILLRAFVRAGLDDTATAPRRRRRSVAADDERGAPTPEPTAPPPARPPPLPPPGS